MKLTAAIAPTLMLALLCAPTPAAAEAGKVLFAFQRVEIVRNGITFGAARGSPVEVGDTVRISPTGFAQLRMKDGALMSLRRGAELVIEEYRLPTKSAAAPSSNQPEAQTVDAQATSGRSIMRLVRGAFRTITGLIGRDASDAYQLKTPAATIGIRGTDYGAAICNGNCSGQADGLYVGVSQGEIFVTNDVGQLVLYDDQYAYVRDTNSNPQQKLAPPPPLEDPIETGDEEDEELGDEGTDAPPPPRTTTGTNTGTDTNPADTKDPEYQDEVRPGAQKRSYAFSTGPLNGTSEHSGAGRADRSGVTVDGNNSLTGFNGAAPSADGTTAAVAGYRIGTASNTNVGFDSNTGIRWGRWAGGVAQVGDSSLDLNAQSLHWISSRERSDVTLPISGSREFTLRGNTDPTDNLGNVGFLGNATFDANFTNGTVTSTLDIGIGSDVWNASGSGNLISGSPLFAGGYDSVSVNGIAGGSGSFAGFFTHQAIGAGLSYSLENGSTSLSGSAAFGFNANADTAPVQP